MQKVIDVHIGQVKIAKNGEQLKAILGSCVAIGIIWKEKNMCGLAHCLLPSSRISTFEIGARSVDQAVRSLIALMKIRSENLSEVEVIVVGGGNMMCLKDSDSSSLVGANNFKAAIEQTKLHGLYAKYLDCGGEEGRKISIDSSSYTFEVEKIPRINQAS